MRDIEGAAAEIVDGEHALGRLVETIGEGGRRRLVHQPQHFQPGKARGILGGAARRIVEIGRHGDDGPADRTAQILFGAGLGRAQDIGRDLDRRQQPVADLEAHHAARPARSRRADGRPGAAHPLRRGPSGA